MQQSSRFLSGGYFQGSFAVTDPVKDSKLRYEELEDRLKTFILPPPWEGSLDAHSMSEAGFVYTGQEDLVYCFSCNIKLDGWTKHMDPLLRHKEESPTCSFVRQQLQVIKGGKGKVKSVVSPSKPLNPRQTASIGQLQSLTLFNSKPIHTVVTGLDEPQSSYVASRGGDDFLLTSLPINFENYRSEAERIRSFVGWPLNESVHPEQLARVGFVYTGEGSLVQCFQCGVRYRNWLKGDIPLSVHQKCSPRCVFVQELARKDKSAKEQRPREPFIDQAQFAVEFPNYTDQATRLQSFKYWGGVLPKEELAEAGFYMIACRDVVRCFSCHVVLQDWERTDNVIDEHRRHNPECPFLAQLPRTLTPSYALKSIDVTPRGQIDTKLTSFSSLCIRIPPNAQGSDEPSPPKPDDEAQGIHYPPSWSSNPPPLSLAPGGSDSEEKVSCQTRVDYNTIISLQQSTSKSKQIVVS